MYSPGFPLLFCSAHWYRWEFSCTDCSIKAENWNLKKLPSQNGRREVLLLYRILWKPFRQETIPPTSMTNLFVGQWEIHSYPCVTSLKQTQKKIVNEIGRHQAWRRLESYYELHLQQRKIFLIALSSLLLSTRKVIRADFFS